MPSAADHNGVEMLNALRVRCGWLQISLPVAGIEADDARRGEDDELTLLLARDVDEDRRRVARVVGAAAPGDRAVGLLERDQRAALAAHHRDHQVVVDQRARRVAAVPHAALELADQVVRPLLGAGRPVEGVHLAGRADGEDAIGGDRGGRVRAGAAIELEARGGRFVGELPQRLAVGRRHRDRGLFLAVARHGVEVAVVAPRSPSSPSPSGRRQTTGGPLSGQLSASSGVAGFQSQRGPPHQGQSASREADAVLSSGAHRHTQRHAEADRA